MIFTDSVLLTTMKTVRNVLITLKVSTIFLHISDIIRIFAVKNKTNNMFNNLKS